MKINSVIESNKKKFNNLKSEMYFKEFKELNQNFRRGDLKKCHWNLISLRMNVKNKYLHFQKYHKTHEC